MTEDAKNLTQDELMDLTRHLVYIDRIQEYGNALREKFDTQNISLEGSEPWQAALAIVSESALPTFLLMKLFVLAENVLDTVLLRQDPNTSLKKLRFGDKVKAVGNIHGVDREALENMRQLRNRCSHDLYMQATWDDWRNQFTEVVFLLSNLERATRNPPSQLVKLKPQKS